MNVFVDFHHGDLYESLRLLFEQRLGWNLYRPIGTEWCDEGFWRLAEPYGNHPSTVLQFLGIGSHVYRDTRDLNASYTVEDGVYHIYDPIRGVHNKAVTLPRFKEMTFDLIISSYGPHDDPYNVLRDRFQPKAKRVAQLGNICQWSNVPNVLCSTMPYPVPKGKNVVFYHQEFDLGIFKYTPPVGAQNVTSFVNCLPEPELYHGFQRAMPDYTFRAHGIAAPDGVVTGLDKIAALMAESGWGWHVKPGGDGFGHVIHNWFACGRPVLVRFSEYRDKLAGQLMTDNDTCINLESGSLSDNIAKIRRFSQPEEHAWMCEGAYRRFKSVVDFDREFENIRGWLGRML